MMKFKTTLSALMLIALLSACAAPGSGGTLIVPSPAPSPSQETDAATDSAAADTPEEELPGILSSFTATDLEGNQVTQDILADYDLTMVNVWATFCGPCLREMPDLGELAGEYEEKGVRFVGLVSDTLDSTGALDEGQIATARDIVAETGANYLHMLPSTDLLWLLTQISAVPTTFFVDSEGRQVGSAFSGSLSRSQWIEVIDGVLEEAGL